MGPIADRASQLRHLLVDAMADVPFMASLPDRQMLLRLIRADVPEFGHVRESAESRLHIVEIVVACLERPRGLPALRAALSTMAPHDRAVARVHDLIDAAPPVDPVGAATAGEPATTGTARSTLPARTAAFTGRDRELGVVVDKVVGAARTGGIIAIHAIDGMAGVGKTTFAVHVGHLLAEFFPDRQLFIDLKGHTAGQAPTHPADALADLLTMEGIPPPQLPTDLDARSAMWRALVADKRVLLILDNAATTDQVRPLLPGSTGCLVLVTSRRMLADLSAEPVAMDTLRPDDARRMLIRLAPRAADEPENVATLVARCGYLPLAISLLAGVLNRRRQWTVRDLLDESTGDLIHMKAESRTVAAAFDMSYRAQPAGVRRVFRLLGLHPGTEFEPYAVAALAGSSVSEARAALDELAGNHLLIEPAYRRYRMHDLVRDYARSLASSIGAPERDVVLDRLLEYYEGATAAAGAQLDVASTPVATPRPGLPAITGRRAALTWLNHEITTITACVDLAERERRPDRVLALTAAVAAYLRGAGPWGLACRLQVAAVQAARHVGRPTAEAAALTELGTVHRHLGDYAAATRVLDEALAIHGTLGDDRSRADALTELAVVRHLSGDYRGATRALTTALTIYRDGGHRDGEAVVLAELGVVHRVTGDMDEALNVLERSLAICRERSDRQGEARTLTNLGLARMVAVDVATGIATLADALRHCVDLDDRVGTADALHFLGLARIAAGDLTGAEEDLHRSARICDEVRYRHGAAGALVALADIHALRGNYRESIEACETADRIYSTLGNLQGQARTLLYLAEALHRVHDLSTAHAVLDRAARLFGEFDNAPGTVDVLSGRGHLALAAGDHAGAFGEFDRALRTVRDSPLVSPPKEAVALNDRGCSLRLLGRVDESVADHSRALGLARRIGYVRQVARALEGLGRCGLDRGHTTTALAVLAQALAIYRSAAPADAARLAADPTIPRT